MYQLLIEHETRSLNSFSKKYIDATGSRNYKRAIQYADGNLKKEIESAAKSASNLLKQKQENERLKAEKEEAERQEKLRIEREEERERSRIAEEAKRERDRIEGEKLAAKRKIEAEEKAIRDAQQAKEDAAKREYLKRTHKIRLIQKILRFSFLAGIIIGIVLIVMGSNNLSGNLENMSEEEQEIYYALPADEAMKYDLLHNTPAVVMVFGGAAMLCFSIVALIIGKFVFMFLLRGKSFSSIGSIKTRPAMLSNASLGQIGDIVFGYWRDGYYYPAILGREGGKQSMINYLDDENGDYVSVANDKLLSGDFAYRNLNFQCCDEGNVNYKNGEVVTQRRLHLDLLLGIQK